MLTLHERLTETGERETVDVGADEGARVVRVAGEATLLPMSVLEAACYGGADDRARLRGALRSPAKERGEVRSIDVLHDEVEFGVALL